MIATEIKIGQIRHDVDSGNYCLVLDLDKYHVFIFCWEDTDSWQYYSYQGCQTTTAVGFKYITLVDKV